MTSEALTFTRFSVELMERSHQRMLEAVEGLIGEQFWFQPAPGANSIGWLVWHLSRFKDIQTGRVANEDEVWVTESWCERFGLPPEANGYGHSPDDVAGFRADLSLLLGYAKAAHAAAVRRVQSATEAELHRNVGTNPNRPRPAYHLLVVNASDYAEHTGQITYLRGVLSGPGWSGPVR